MGRIPLDEGGVTGVEVEEVDEDGGNAPAAVGDVHEARDARVEVVAFGEDDREGLEEEVDHAIYELVGVVSRRTEITVRETRTLM